MNDDKGVHFVIVGVKVSISGVTYLLALSAIHLLVVYRRYLSSHRYLHLLHENETYALVT